MAIFNYKYNKLMKKRQGRVVTPHGFLLLELMICLAIFSIVTLSCFKWCGILITNNRNAIEQLRQLNQLYQTANCFLHHHPKEIGLSQYDYGRVIHVPNTFAGHNHIQRPDPIHEIKISTGKNSDDKTMTTYLLRTV